jgi:hypothetical protein
LSIAWHIRSVIVRASGQSKRQRRYERQPPKVIPPSDPQSAWTAKANKRVQFAYGLNYLIDIENADRRCRGDAGSHL